jgi:CheY-like chemotaxis protein
MDKDRIKILVLDDEKMILNAFHSLMMQKRDQYKAGFFIKPEDAIEEIKNHPDRYHIIMSDINMPGMDGIEFVQTIRKIPCDLPIVFMTGYNSPEVQERIKKLDKVTLLEKPFQLKKVLEQIVPQLLGR